MQAPGVAVGGPQYHKEMRWTGGEKAGTGLVGGGRKTGGAISSGWMGQVPWTGGVCLFLGGPIGCRDRGSLAGGRMVCACLAERWETEIHVGDRG